MPLWIIFPRTYLVKFSQIFSIWLSRLQRVRGTRCQRQRHRCAGIHCRVDRIETAEPVETAEPAEPEPVEQPGRHDDGSEGDDDRGEAEEDAHGVPAWSSE